MSKQTPVDWLAEKYNYVTWMHNRDEISAGMADEWRKHYLDQAKQMEKEQIENAFQEGKWDWHNHITNGIESKDLAQYYNETYGK